MENLTKIVSAAVEKDERNRSVVFPKIEVYAKPPTIKEAGALPNAAANIRLRKTNGVVPGGVWGASRMAEPDESCSAQAREISSACEEIKQRWLEEAKAIRKAKRMDWSANDSCWAAESRSVAASAMYDECDEKWSVTVTHTSGWEGESTSTETLGPFTGLRAASRAAESACATKWGDSYVCGFA